MKPLIRLCLLLLPGIFMLSSANASNRIALVIGNAAYEQAPLVNPINDARAMAVKLRQFDFDVVEAIDADLVTMQNAVLDFMERVDGDSTVLVYFAGHGIQANGRNYLLPVDANAENERALRFEAMELNDILEELEEFEAKISIVILDACRNNPFQRKFRGGARGLAVVDAAQGTLIAYATAPGSVASDGVGENGLYTQELLKAMDQPGLKVEEVFKVVRREVADASGGEQIPWESSSLVGDFIFNRQVNVAINQTVNIQQPAPVQSANVEMMFWQAIEASENPEDFADYLQQYPGGAFAGIARRRLASLQATPQSSCADLSGLWYASLVDAAEGSCRDTFTLSRQKGDTYDIDYSVCGAMDAVTNIRGKGTLEDTTLSFKWRSMPCSGTTEYVLDQKCQAGTGRVVKRGGLPGVCNMFVNKSLVVNVERAK
ncbi:MAG: caspase domain-containing protein [Pseudomonadales bacterium]